MTNTEPTKNRYEIKIVDTARNRIIDRVNVVATDPEAARNMAVKGGFIDDYEFETGMLVEQVPEKPRPF